MPDEEIFIGPAKISIPTFLLKILASTFGGAVGSLLLALIYVLSSTLLSPLVDGATDITVGPVFIFLLLIMAFISSTVGNVLAVFLTSLTEREKYKRTSSAVFQIAVQSVIVFLLMVPVYFITSTIDITVNVYAVALHLILTAIISALTLEVVSNYKYSLVGIYAITFALVFSSGIIFGIAKFVNNAAILLFLALPIIWGSIGLFQSLTTIIYGWLARIYDKDFLSTQSLYCDDYGKSVEQYDDDASSKSSSNEQEGADFLKHNN